MRLWAHPEPTLDFIESDGKPVGETGIHAAQVNYLMAAVPVALAQAGRVGAHFCTNVFFYYDPDDSRRSVVPDFFVFLNLPRPEEPRRTYKLWEEGTAPDLIVEVCSRSTIEEDVYRKKGIYQDVFRTREYVLFDPDADVIPGRLRAFRLVEGAYQEAEVPFRSEVLDATVAAVEGNLRLLDRDGRVIPGTVLEGRADATRDAVRRLCRIRFGAEAAARLEPRLAALSGEDALSALFDALAVAPDLEAVLRRLD